MHRFEFTTSVQTGNIDFDIHCRALFAMANTILESENLQKSHDRFRHAVKSLVAYLDYHLLSEELIMARTRYPSRLFHMAFHQQTRSIAAQLEAGTQGPYDCEEAKNAVFFMIEDWVVYHVLSADRHLADFLRDAHATGSTLRLPSIRDLKTEGSLPPDFDEHLGDIAAEADC